jgi:hypothetical protein
MNITSRLTRLNAKLDRAVEFAGGYENTPIGVMKQKGAKAHFIRNKGKYIGGLLGLPGIGVGYFVDRSRRKSNMRLTEIDEPKVKRTAK